MKSLSLALLAVALPLMAQDETFRWQGSIAAGGRLEIRGVNGNVKAEPSTGALAEVTAVKSGRKSDPRQVEIKVVEDGDGVTICAVYPSRDAARPNECKPGGGRNNTSNNDVRVEFTVRVPSGVRFLGNTVNGGIEAAGLNGDIELHTVNGRIKASTMGCAEAKTVNGGIEATVGRTDCARPMEFTTVNGGVTLGLPASTNAELNVETVNGGIDSDLPLTLRGKISNKRLTATLGSGGREIRVKTVNGGVNLRKTS